MDGADSHERGVKKVLSLHLNSFDVICYLILDLGIDCWGNLLFLWGRL